MKLISGTGAVALCCMSLIVQASEPSCTTGKLAYVEGEINNNAVAFVQISNEPPVVLPVTLGVAELKIFKKHGRKKHGRKKLTCTLLGNPNIPTDDQPHTHNYDHLIVCDDQAQSQIALDTSFVGASPLDRKLERKLCRGDVDSYFQEESIPDPTAKHDLVGGNKGIFQGVDEGSILVTGCVNTGSDSDYDVQINMVFDGYVCLVD